MFKFQSPIDRHAQIRNNPEKILTCLSHEDSRFVLLFKGQIVTSGQTELFFKQSDVKNQLSKTVNKENKCLELHLEQTSIYLGHIDLTHYFAIQLDDLIPPLSHKDVINLRQASLTCDADQIGFLFHAQGLINWHWNHQYCAKCGGKTQMANAGHSRICSDENCQKEHFPRLDPAVIFSISNTRAFPSKLLLARQANWDEGRYSVIAGFVEPGETLEQAVAREAWEEVGLKLDQVVYLSSQPWPFPSSLMVGFEAETTEENIRLIDKEIEHAMWVTADDIESRVKSGELKLPFSVSISWSLVNRWFRKEKGYSINEIGCDEQNQ
ncbi:NAD(+) diphosphatase [Aliikangiella sp. G2MR2-5]|uniref:NAD(+) diphosphatase n=1 Tax=Aliikangiella sp. G2MR2-5 TaxID=2788943 RepID=UPI0018A89733|nr:NAD(+) diphosphatase [Aliikangiella sp. G2MR2-5]